MAWNNKLIINDREISVLKPSYFIADIAANHDGDLNRAKELIWQSKEAGADCAKFQHFEAGKIVSDYGFSGQFAAVSHQSEWKKSVAEIYDEYHTRREWTLDLVSECKAAEIDFMTTPYDLDAIAQLDQFLPAYKIGSGDITNLEILNTVAEQNKPVFLATGASDINDCLKAANTILNKNRQLCIMQCNTNYTGDIENFKFVNLNVLKQFSTIWPNMVLGLSDHTPGHSAVLGAIALGARVIEKHFTDDNMRVGPDHKFALNPKTWREMVNATRELELALGDGVKRVEENEHETVIIQRRALRLTRDITRGEVLSHSDFEALRPCPIEAVNPMQINDVVGKRCVRDLKKGQHISNADVQ